MQGALAVHALVRVLLRQSKLRPNRALALALVAVRHAEDALFQTICVCA